MTWSVKVVPDQTSQAVPALAWFRTDLHMVYLGEHSNRLYHTVYPAPNGPWSAKGPIGEQSSQAAPALAAFGPVGNELHMVYLGEHSQSIYHSIWS